MNEEALIKYYNKFNEDKRLNTRHGKVEFVTTLKYIDEYLSKMSNPKIIDIGAGTGRYSIHYANMGYDVYAVELIKHNLKVIEAKSNKVKTFLKNATDLSNFNDETFDLTLLFGPMYHLITNDDKIKALREAKRITKKNGIIMVAYIMNDYCILTHGFKDNNIINAKKNSMIDENYKCVKWENNLYSVVRLEDIDRLNNSVDLKRLKIITPDGPANYMRATLNKMTEEEFREFLGYHFKTCERLDMIGAAAHTLDILIKE